MGIAIGIAVLFRNHLHVFSVVINSLSHKSCATQLYSEFVGTATGVAQKPFRVFHTRSSDAKQQSEAERTKEICTSGSSVPP